MLTGKEKQLPLIIFSLSIAAIFIAICSKNSFLYPMQDWVDVNCFFTTGKTIANGAVLYRDVFEQKGPILHFLYAIAYFISSHSFLGVYLLETLSFGLFLYISGKTLQLYTEKNTTIFSALTILAFTITTSMAFAHGGSVEELCLFGLALGIYTSLRALKFGIESISKKLWFLNGLCVGFIFWIKYTMLGLYIGAFLFFFFYILCTRKKGVLPIMIGFVALGFVVISLPVFIYFIANGALYDLWDGYFYKNIFLYSSEVSLFNKLITVVLAVYNTIACNIPYALFIAIGGLWALYKRNLETLFLIVATVFWALGTYIGGVTYYYYGLTICVFAIFGFKALIEISQKHNFSLKGNKTTIILALLLIILPFASYHISGNTYLMSYEKEELPQYKFASQINKKDNATLLNYGFLDGGFYFAADIVPAYEYFCAFNMDIPELNEQMEQLIVNQEVDFIVTRNEKLEDTFNNIKYECIDEEEFFFEGSNWTYYLYQKTN